MAPKLPMRESFMISSTRALVQPPPSPSQVSAQPSSWKAPVTRMVAAIDSTTAMSIGSTCAASQNTAAPVAPTSQPTRGRKRAAWLSFSGAKATQPGTGRRVK